MLQVEETRPQAEETTIENLLAKRQEACSYLEAHRRDGNTEGVWFHLGYALALHEALVELGESDGSDLPCADPSTLVEEAPKDEQGMRLGLLFEAIGDMDFADDLTPEQAEAFAQYRNRAS